MYVFEMKSKRFQSYSLLTVIFTPDEKHKKWLMLNIVIQEVVKFSSNSFFSFTNNLFIMLE